MADIIRIKVPPIVPHTAKTYGNERRPTPKLMLQRITIHERTFFGKGEEIECGS